MTTIIDGTSFAEKVRTDIATQTRKLKIHGVIPGLAVIIVGDDPASHIYVRNKAKQSQQVGFKSVVHTLGAGVSQAELLDVIQQLNLDDEIHGILVQLPLPEHIDDTMIINAIAVEKDVDGFSISNVGKLTSGEQATTPCTPLGCMMLLNQYFSGDISGKHAVVIGRSNIVGKPMSALLLRANATVTVAHSRTENIQAICRLADIVVVAVGRAHMVKKDWIKQGAVLIDVGINRIEHDGQSTLVGDVDAHDVHGVAGAITPVPGGVGPMTIACLLHNTLQAAQKKCGM